MNLPVAVLLAVTLSGVSHAANLDHCWSGNTLEINECMNEVLRKTDKKLDSTFEVTLRMIRETTYTMDSTESDKQRKDVERMLREAQNNWVAYRKADCGAVYRDWEQGSVKNMMYLQCMIARAEERTSALKKWRDWKY